jgi:hypothetical protein
LLRLLHIEAAAIPENATRTAPPIIHVVLRARRGPDGNPAGRNSPIFVASDGPGVSVPSTVRRFGFIVVSSNRSVTFGSTLIDFGELVASWFGSRCGPCKRSCTRFVTQRSEEWRVTCSSSAGNDGAPRAQRTSSTKDRHCGNFSGSGGIRWDTNHRRRRTDRDQPNGETRLPTDRHQRSI